MLAYFSVYADFKENASPENSRCLHLRRSIRDQVTNAPREGGVVGARGGGEVGNQQQNTVSLGSRKSVSPYQRFSQNFGSLQTQVYQRLTAERVKYFSFFEDGLLHKFLKMLESSLVIGRIEASVVRTGKAVRRCLVCICLC